MHAAPSDHTPPARRALRSGAVAALLLALAISSTACFTPEELRARSEALPDPRQAEADLIWAAILQVVEAEESWPVDFKRREDLVLTTEWMPQAEGLRKRVRFMVVLAPMGVGINVLIKHQRLDPDAEAQWQDFSDDALDEAEKREEALLVQRVQRLWQASR